MGIQEKEDRKKVKDKELLEIYAHKNHKAGEFIGGKKMGQVGSEEHHLFAEILANFKAGGRS